MMSLKTRNPSKLNVYPTVFRIITGFLPNLSLNKVNIVPTNVPINRTVPEIQSSAGFIIGVALEGGLELHRHKGVTWARLGQQCKMDPEGSNIY